MRSNRKRTLAGLGATITLASIIAFLLMAEKPGDEPEVCGSNIILDDDVYPVSQVHDFYDPLCDEYDKGGNCVEIVKEWQPYSLPYSIWGYVPDMTYAPPTGQKNRANHYSPNYGGGGSLRSNVDSGSCEVQEPSVIWIALLGLVGLVAVRLASK